MNKNKSVFQYAKEDLKLEVQKLSFRFPIEILDSLLKVFFKGFEQASFLIQVNKNVDKLRLKKIAVSYLLQIPDEKNSNEHLYIGISDSLNFLILFNEPDINEKNKNDKSEFLLSFDSESIQKVLNYFYENISSTLEEKEKKFLEKLKNTKTKELSPHFIAKFQEALLINALNNNNKTSHEKLIEAISFTDESIVITDLNGIIKDFNPNFQTNFDLKKSLINIKELISSDLISQAMSTVYSNKSWQTELEFKNVDGKQNFFIVSCYQFKDELQRICGYVFIFKDVTSLKNLNLVNKQLIKKLREKNIELTEVNKRLVEADKIKTDLLSIVSHELKTPMSTIIGFSELIFEREYEEDTVKGFAKEINTSAKKLNNLLSDYLNIASNYFGAQDGKLNTQAINIEQLIKVIFEEEKTKYLNRDFTFEINVLGYEPVIITEQENIRKLFSNLINNSLKYSPDGGKVLVKIFNDGKTITISIADEGVGISLDQAKYVFDPFYRSDNSITREFPGIGLGLAVCKKIVEIYNGSIWCEPGIDSGTIFYVTLPVNPHIINEKPVTLNEKSINAREEFSEL